MTITARPVAVPAITAVPAIGPSYDTGDYDLGDYDAVGPATITVRPAAGVTLAPIAFATGYDTGDYDTGDYDATGPGSITARPYAGTTMRSV